MVMARSTKVRERGRCSRRSALKVRVPVTGRIWMVTVTGSSLTATTPRQRQPDRDGLVGGDAGHRDRVRIDLAQLGELVGVPGHEDDEWIDGDRFDLEPGRRAAGDDRVDGQRPTLAI
jgi:hypothetical protein